MLWVDEIDVYDMYTQKGIKKNGYNEEQIDIFYETTPEWLFLTGDLTGKIGI